MLTRMYMLGCQHKQLTQPLVQLTTGDAFSADDALGLSFGFD